MMMKLLLLRAVLLLSVVVFAGAYGYKKGGIECPVNGKFQGTSVLNADGREFFQCRDPGCEMNDGVCNPAFMEMTTMAKNGHCKFRVKGTGCGGGASGIPFEYKCVKK